MAPLLQIQMAPPTIHCRGRCRFEFRLLLHRHFLTVGLVLCWFWTSHCLESGVTFSMRAIKLSRNSVLLLDSSRSLQYSLKNRHIIGTQRRRLVVVHLYMLSIDFQFQPNHWPISTFIDTNVQHHSSSMHLSEGDSSLSFILYTFFTTRTAFSVHFKNMPR